MKKELLLIYNLTIQEQNGKRLNQFHFWMPEGELVHILGISNAGKTTLYRYLAGELASKSGFVRYQGIEYSAGKLFDGFKNLICIGEKSSLIDELSVAENICIITGKRKVKGVIHRRNMNYRVNLLLGQYAKEIHADQQVKNLSTVQRHIVELLRAIENEIPLVYIDDAFNNYGQEDMQRILQLICVLQEKGISIIYASRKNDLISQKADRKIIMRHGKNVKTFYKEDYDEKLCRKWLIGRPKLEGFERKKYMREEVIFSCKNIFGNQFIKAQSLQIHKGEVLGLYDMNNKANYEFLDIITGKNVAKRGEMYLDGQKYYPQSLEEAVRKGIGYVPMRNTGSSVVESMTFAENLMLPIMLKTSMFHFIKNKRIEKYLGKEYQKYCGISAIQQRQKMSKLDVYQRTSVEFYKWVLTRPKVLVCEEVCEELDIQMRNIVYEALEHLAENGTAVVIISQNIGELKKICDRVCVMNSGDNSSESGIYPAY